MILLVNWGYPRVPEGLIIRRETFREKRSCGKFMRDVSEVADERLWQYLIIIGCTNMSLIIIQFILPLFSIGTTRTGYAWTNGF